MGAVKIRHKLENRSPDTREKITSRFKMSGSRVPVTMRDFFFDDPFFKNSWEDFDKVRNAMFTESRDMWKKFDDDFRNMACMSNNIMLESPSRAAGEQEEVASNLSSDGVLVITAPKKALAIK